MWTEYTVSPQSDGLLDTDIFHDPQVLYDCQKIGTVTDIHSYEMVVDLDGVQEFSLSGIKLKPNPQEKRNEILEQFHMESKKRSERDPIVFDESPLDDNGHIQIDDWNPYQDETRGLEDEHWDEMIWEGTTDTVTEKIDWEKLYLNE